MHMRFACLTIMGLIFASPAFAADLPVKGPWPPPPVRVFTWTACYLGAMVGGGWGHKELADPTAIITGAASVPAVTVDPSGWLVGAQAGCDLQFAGNTVVGLEGAFAGGRIEGHSAVIPLGGTDSATATARLDALATLTGRVGYAIDRSLLYAKAGFAWADERYSAVGTFGGNAFDLEGPATRFAWTVGAGVEWAFSDYWAVRLEYDFYDFGDRRVTFSDTTSDLFSGAAGVVDVKQTIHTIKLGLSFRFMAGPPLAAPVVTKY
jgi:outer membrane immunogenic protein